MPLPADPADLARGNDQARRDELDTIDPGWCLVWDTEWQRCYRLVQNHTQACRTLPTADGDVVLQGEDLGRWDEEEVSGAGFDDLVAVDEVEVAGQDVERFLLAAVGVWECAAELISTAVVSPVTHLVTPSSRRTKMPLRS